MSQAFYAEHVGRARDHSPDVVAKSKISRLFEATVKRVRTKGVAADQSLHHVIVSWQPGEVPAVAQARDAVAKALERLE